VQEPCTRNLLTADAEDQRGLALLAAGNLDEAIAAFRSGIALDPGFSNAHLDLGAALVLAGRRQEALPALQQALTLQPGWQPALYNLGTTLRDLGDIPRAITTFQEALALYPDWSVAHNQLGLTLLSKGETDEAQRCLERALALDPGLHSASHFLAGIHWHRGDAEAAMEVWRQGLAYAPLCRDCHLCLGMALLARGRYTEGWEEYEWRWACGGEAPELSGLSQPVWDGCDLDGRGIVLVAEQGLGDILMFVRFAPLVAARGGVVQVLSRPSLDRLLATCPGVERAVSTEGELAECSFQIPLASLPRVLGIGLHDLPAAPIPYLTPPRRRRDPLGPRRGGELRVGIVWGVEPGHPFHELRSCPLPQLRPLAEVPGVDLYSLQFGALAAGLRQPGAPRAADLSAVLGDFADTAAVVAELDLVITVDTAMAHLAGALGRPVWVLIPHRSDWRWLLGREDSPWYPTMRLFRQEKTGTWEAVIERVAAALRELATERRLADGEADGDGGCRAN
jgi:Flp pilus assembly protein TadD